MKPVRDDDGTRYLLLKRSAEASLVRDPTTGNECYVRNDRLEPEEDATVLETAATGVDPAIRRLLRGVHDDETLGFLLELAERGATDVRTILERYDVCESDLHGRLAELAAAGLLEEVDVDGERGYRISDDCERALSAIRDATTASEDELTADAPD
ncbi:DUF7346 family protein [Natrialbaceae archaeon AArc-T1-2]|uniref:DUF7346 family protein n=1 Tax=Natrialbaceae archaeon AArc-T1-2 TaxID=3053904 RepID=UPI00255A9D4D|nr:hypothetical protein [Natrialbaceae archaeon AArc-T1-2]WIV67623.1 hypothetical protein QQ977_02515 [Natrialbaceae archaeon AArc-T1-2]